MAKITSFTDLYVWQEGHKLVLEIYRVTTSFPKEERFSLTDQMRRSVVSITSNIAEGFSRHSYKEKVQFYYTALGSLTELQNQLLVARDVSYLEHSIFNEIAIRAIVVQKLVNGIIRSSKESIPNS